MRGASDDGYLKPPQGIDGDVLNIVAGFADKARRGRIIPAREIHLGHGFACNRHRGDDGVSFVVLERRNERVPFGGVDLAFDGKLAADRPRKIDIEAGEPPFLVVIVEGRVI